MKLLTGKSILRFTALILLFVNAWFGHSHAYAEDCSSKSVSADLVLQGFKEKQKWILVDVLCGNKEFETFRIPGSLNIPLFALKTKTFLKSRPLVLINEGHSYHPVIQECAALSEWGFTLSILDGGLYQWRQKGGPIEGDVFAQRELSKISPQTLFSGRAYENWIFIDISQPGQRAVDHHLNGLHVPYTNPPVQFISELKNTLGKQKSGPFLSVVLSDEQGKNYEEIERHVRNAGIHNVLYLKGGLEAYRSFEKQQIRMSQGKGEGSRKKGGSPNRNCKTCP